MDGTVGELMNRAKISHMRPAHIHFAITAPGYRGCITHLFQKGDKFIENDAVFGLKEPLIVEFVKKPPGKYRSMLIHSSDRMKNGVSSELTDIGRYQYIWRYNLRIAPWFRARDFQP
jgi:protocatechuate 3,4-dioxygenase beta subunit